MDTFGASCETFNISHRDAGAARPSWFSGLPRHEDACDSYASAAVTSRGPLQLAPFVVAFVASIAAVRYDFFEYVCMHVRRYDGFELDELVIGALFFALAGCVWLLRRTLLLQAAVRQTRALERQSHALARIDALTGLPNRRAFVETLANVQAGLVLLFIDLDGFKKINDQSGHVIGDNVLCGVAERLTSLRDCGRLTIAARMGGDEFACLCRGNDENVVRDLGELISAPLPFLPKAQRVTASIGVVPLPAGNFRFDDLLRCADSAMYVAKRSGGAAAHRFDAACAA